MSKSFATSGLIAWLAWLLWALSIVLTAGLVLLAFLNGDPSAWGQLFGSIAIATFPTVGALVAARRPRNPMGWLILAIALSFASSTFASEYALYALITAPGALPVGLAMAWLSTWVGLPGSVLLLTFFFQLFPTGHLPSPRWRVIAWLAGAILVLGSLAKAFSPGNVFVANSPIPNPLGIESAGPLLQWLNDILKLIGIPFGALCAASIVLRFRRARGEERQQLKWFAFGIGLVVLFFVVTLSSLLTPSVKSNVPESVADIIFGLVISLPAIAIGIAILKYRLYDIDLIINRTLVYGILTGMLLLTYFGGVVFLQAVLRPLTGQSNDLAIVASTLAIAALFSPLRRRIQAIIDRRFYRRKYDAAKTLASFSQTVRDEVDLAALADSLVAVVEETMEPSRISLWLRPTEREYQVGGNRAS
ncbi:MAG: hypothetical protein ACR2M0_00395 [Chloroflexia bacterium]